MDKRELEKELQELKRKLFRREISEDNFREKRKELEAKIKYSF